MAYGLACPCIVIPAFTFIILGEAAVADETRDPCRQAAGMRFGWVPALQCAAAGMADVGAALARG
jgi:hypothetical protein